MRTNGFLLLALLLVWTAAPAMAAHPSVGANWGIAIYNVAGGNTTIIGVPGEVTSFQPGLRFGATDEKMRNGLYFDLGFSLLGGGGTFHAIEAIANYQYAFPSEKLSSPYLTFGAGAISIGSSSSFGGGAGSTSLVLGGGLGVRTKLESGHGALRLEVRVDRIVESELIRKATLYGIKGGFDLFIK